MRAYLGDPANWRRRGPLARFIAPNAVLICGALLQLYLACTRRCARCGWARTFWAPSRRMTSPSTGGRG